MIVPIHIIQYSDTQLILNFKRNYIILVHCGKADSKESVVKLKLYASPERKVPYFVRVYSVKRRTSFSNCQANAFRNSREKGTADVAAKMFISTIHLSSRKCDRTVHSGRDRFHSSCHRSRSRDRTRLSLSLRKIEWRCN